MSKRKLPPSQRPERHSNPELLRDWTLRFRKHWQAAHKVLADKPDLVLLASPNQGLDHPPQHISYLPRSEAYGALQELGLPILSSLDDPARPGRFYCVATAQGVGTCVCEMLPDDDDLPHIMIGRYGAELGIIVDPYRGLPGEN